MSLFAARTRSTALLLLAVSLIGVLLLPPAVSASTVGARPTAENPGSSLVTLVSSDASGITFDAVAPTFDLAAQSSMSAEGDQPCSTVRATGLADSQDAGKPQLPVKIVLFGAPPGAELALNVKPVSARVAAEDLAVCPAPTLSKASTDGAAAPSQTLDRSVYDANALYPAQSVRVVDLGFMRSQRILRVEIYPFQYNPVTRELLVVDSLRATISFRPTASSASAATVTEPASFESAFRQNLLNYDSAREWRQAPVQAAEAAAWAPPQPGYKVLLQESGIYHLTRSALASAGLPVDSIDPRTFMMSGGGQQIAVRVTGEEDGKFDSGDEIIFYGESVDTRYTGTAVYWLGYGGAPGLRMAVRPSVSGGSYLSSYTAIVRKEENSVYDSDLPMLPGYDHWYGQSIQAVGAGKTGSTLIAMATPELAPGAPAAELTVMLGAVTTGSHHVRLYVNPTTNPAQVVDATWDGPTTYLVSATFPGDHLKASGNNSIKIEVINDFAGRAADILRLDWAQLAYQRPLVAESDKLIFGPDGAGWATAGPKQFSVGGFSSSNVDLYDVTNPAGVIQITGATVGASAAGATAPEAFALQFGDDQPAPRRYAAWDRAQLLAPLSIRPDQVANLHAKDQGADYIIVTHRDFAEAVQPLAVLRASQPAGTNAIYLPMVVNASRAGTGAAVGASVSQPARTLRVRVIDVQDIYDEFGGGLMSAGAIRDFVAYAYNNWSKPAPSNLLLVGDGTYDFRHYKSAAETYIPPYLEMVDPDAGETATDNRFVAVTPGDILPDLNVGRLPANTPAEATTMVNKILAYEGQPGKPWTKQVLFVADDLEGGGGDFYAYSDGIADGYAKVGGANVKILPADYTPTRVYLGQTCDLSNPATSVECRDQIVGRINSGSLMVSYIGHGTKTYWAAEHLYDAAAFTQLANSGKLPVMLPMTCNEGYFIDPAEPSLSELGIRAEGEGSIATWAPTGYGLAPGHDYLERGLFLALFNNGQLLGSATTSAKLYLVANAPANNYRDLIDTFLLLGDPALQVR